MGLLDPKMDKERTFELLRKKHALRAILEFSGGHDEGDVESITLHLDDGSTEQLEVWYCGGYGMADNPNSAHEWDKYLWVPMSTPANEDEELSDLLQGPINECFGAWGGVANTAGILAWDRLEGTATMSFGQDETVTHEYEVSWPAEAS